MRKNVPEEDHDFLEDEGLPSFHDDVYDEAEMRPRDDPQAVDDLGTTAEEQQEGEPLAVRLARETPAGRGGDLAEEEGSPTGRLVDPEADLGEVDETPDMIGEDVGVEEGGFSAEERAVRIEDEGLGRG